MAFKTDVNPSDNTLSLGDNNSKKWKINGHVNGYIEITVDLASTNGQTLTISDSRITANHIVINTISPNLVGYILTPI